MSGSEEVKHRLYELSFTWDDEKNASNRVKHGLDFYDAAEIFFGLKVYTEQTSFSPDEERWKIFGYIADIDVGLLCVVFTWREADGEKVIRIISARRAKRKERVLYEKGD